jgi:hypothetical protein
MKYTVLILIVFFAIVSCKESKMETTDVIEYENAVSTDLPEILKDIPVGIEVINEPSKIYAEIDPKDTSKYYWKLKTYLKAMNTDVKIIEFGDYEKNSDGSWVLHNYSGRKFTSKEFSEWYFVSKTDEFSWENAVDAKIKKEVSYVDVSNWTNRSDSLVAQKGIWYFIGLDANNKKVMGYAEYENLPELSNDLMEND